MVVGVINTDGNYMTRGYFGLPLAANMKDRRRTFRWARRPAVWFAVCDAYLDELTELTKYQLTPVDAFARDQAQNAKVAAGRFFRRYAAGKGQQLNARIIAQTRLTSTDLFGKIPLKVNQMAQVRLRDV